MSIMLFANNATSRLYSAIDAATTSIRVENGDGGKFPSPTGGDYFTVTVEDRRTGQIEIMKCTGRSGDILNVSRAQEGTAGQAFAYGATVSNRATAGTMNYLVTAATVGEVPNDGKDYARHYGGWTVTISKVTYDNFVSSQASKDAAQDTNISNNAANVAANTSNIATNTSDIAAIKVVNSNQDASISSLQANKADKSYVDTQNSAQDSVINTKADKTYVDNQNNNQNSIIATKADKTYVDSQDALKANIASPVFTGDPQAPTPATADNDTSIATTAFVKTNIAAVAQFPEAPQDGLTYGRKNATWATVIGGAHTDDLPPPGPLVDGQLWWKSDSGTFYVYYDDGNSKQWVEAAAPAVPSAAYVQKTARRSNLVINGALNVSQENGNTEGTTNQYYAADQLLAGFSAASAAFGLARIAAANPSGSQYRLQFRVTTAKASLAAGDVAGITTRLEGLNVQDLGWSNATSQKDAVLAFGFRGPAGTYSVALRNNSAGVTHTFVASFTVTAGQANTDTQQVIKVPAPVAMTTWAVDNTCAIELWITLACGTTYLAAAGWNSGNFLGVTGMSNGLAAVQSFQIWDIGLYADPDKTGVPPVFEVPDYATEFAKCMRYWESGSVRWDGQATTSTSFGVQGWFKAPKRATPSLSGVSTGATCFPATTGLAVPTPTNFLDYRTANASAAGTFSSNWIANARM